MKKQREKKMTIWMRLSLFAVIVVFQVVLFQQNALVVNAQGTAKVSAASGKIRESASTSSEVLASVTKGNKLDIIAQTTDSEGYTWYKVYVDGQKTGYIRADLVGNVSGTVKTEKASSGNSGNSASESSNETTQQVQFVQVTESEATAGKVVGAASVNVRQNPSTSAAVAGKADEGTEVTISGESVDNAGKVWYQVNFGTTTGFIRSDYLEITQNVDAEAEETTETVEEETEEEAEEEVVNKEYEVVYETNSEGVNEWFLYDHNRGTKQSVANLLAVVRKTQEDGQSAASQLKTFKLLAVAMVAVIIVLIIVVTILVFKLKDAYEYEYDDDDEEDDEDDDDDIEEDEDEDDEEEEDVVVRKPLFRKASKEAAKETAKDTLWEAEDVRKSEVQEEVVKATSAPVEEKQTKDTSWQSKNFLDIDDDMEFEFLDLK